MNPVEAKSVKPIRLVIIDDELLVAKSLGNWLAKSPGLEIIGYAPSGNQGWELCAATLPELALVDVEMPDGDGPTLAQRLRDRLPETRVIIMTGRVDPYTAWRAGQIGVHGLIDKTIDPEELVKVIHLVMEGGGFISPAFKKVKTEWLTEPESFQKILTPRELAVLCRVTEGESDLAIGLRLDISAETVACHRKSLRKKLGVHDDRSLVAYGREWGTFDTSVKDKSQPPKEAFKSPPAIHLSAQ